VPQVAGASDQGIPRRGFISYRHDDDEDFGHVVERLTKDIRSMYAAETGFQLELFFDRDSIGWGEHWQSRIHESVRSATLFIPVVTMRYFESKYCLTEMIMYHESASALAVPELILPLVLFGSDQLQLDSARPEVRLLSQHQHIDIKAGWVDGFESATWRRTITQCVVGVRAALSRAEQVLADSQQNVIVESETNRVIFMGRAADIRGMLRQTEESVQQATESVNKLADGLREAAGTAGLDDSGRPGSSAIPVVVARLRDTAEDFERKSTLLLSSVMEVDGKLRRFLSDSKPFKMDAIFYEREKLLHQVRRKSQSEEPIESKLDSTAASLREIAASNVPLRTAFLPAERGILTMKTAFELITGWPNLN